MSRCAPLFVSTWLIVASAAIPTQATEPPPQIGELPHTVWPQEMSPRQIAPQIDPDPDPLQLSVLVDRRTRPDTDRDLVLVLVEAAIAETLQPELDALAGDLQREGYDAVVEAVAGGSPEDIKAHLVQLREQNLTGALMVGDLPQGWYEVADDYDEYGYAAFPCDLYFMDLDGAWIDADGNGIFDGVETAAGTPLPEIWIGHLIVTAAMGDEIELLRDYFHRNHSFRTGSTRPDGSALLYVDDDWAYGGDYFAWELSAAYGDLVTEWDLQTTCVDDYRPRLTQSFDLVSVYVHSAPDAHYFVRNNVYEIMSWTAIPSEADALFYYLFACSNANFADYTYMAGQYVLGTDRGLLAVGSTKTGSMWMAEAFYGALGRHETFGDAALDWWWTIYPFDDSDISWFFGVTLIGDPTLRIDYPVLAVDPGVIAVEASDDGPVEIELLVDNEGVQSFEWVVSWDAGWIDVTPTHGEISDDSIGLTMTIDPAAVGYGTHADELVFSSVSAVNTPLRLPVELVYSDPRGDAGGCAGCGVPGRSPGPQTSSMVILTCLLLRARRRRS